MPKTRKKIKPLTRSQVASLGGKARNKNLKRRDKVRIARMGGNAMWAKMRERLYAAEMPPVEPEKNSQNTP